MKKKIIRINEQHQRMIRKTNNNIHDKLNLGQLNTLTANAGEQTE